MVTTDPVCRTEVDPTDADRTTEYGGEAFFFCSPRCLEAFVAGPEPYVNALRIL